jgi:hypothetical protein
MPLPANYFSSLHPYNKNLYRACTRDSASGGIQETDRVSFDSQGTMFSRWVLCSLGGYYVLRVGTQEWNELNGHQTAERVVT